MSQIANTSMESCARSVGQHLSFAKIQLESAREAPNPFRERSYIYGAVFHLHLACLAYFQEIKLDELLQTMTKVRAYTGVSHCLTLLCELATKSEGKGQYERENYRRWDTRIQEVYNLSCNRTNWLTEIAELADSATHFSASLEAAPNPTAFQEAKAELIATSKTDSLSRNTVFALELESVESLLLQFENFIEQQRQHAIES